MKQKIEHYTNRAGGKGTIQIERLLVPSELGPHVSMYAKVSVDVHSSIGYHPHIKDSESYYILEGNALYLDNGVEKILQKGDVTFTPAGSSHGIENIGSTPLIIMALIINNAE